MVLWSLTGYMCMHLGFFCLVVKIANSLFMNWHGPMGLYLLFQQFGNRMVHCKQLLLVTQKICGHF